MLKANMPYLSDEEGSMVPSGLPPVIDAHVHLFPKTIFSAVWKWFNAHAYHIRYQLRSTQLVDFLLSRGVQHIIALQYAHKPGIAHQLNEYMAKKAQQYNGRLTALATVFPGEQNADWILQHAFNAGLKGVKLHMHVQCFDMNHECMDPLYECCQNNDKPLVIHAGREPKSDAYSCDAHQLCCAENVERVLRDFPTLKICVPHMGFDEVEVYRVLLERYDNLWLDTAMVLADYFPVTNTIKLAEYRSDRVMYGSDFPNIPYAWDRELKALAETSLNDDALEMVAYKNAVEFFNIELDLV